MRGSTLVWIGSILIVLTLVIIGVWVVGSGLITRIDLSWFRLPDIDLTPMRHFIERGWDTVLRSIAVPLDFFAKALLITGEQLRDAFSFSGN